MLSSFWAFCVLLLYKFFSQLENTCIDRTVYVCVTIVEISLCSILLSNFLGFVLYYVALYCCLFLNGLDFEFYYVDMLCGVC